MKYKKQIVTGALALSLLIAGSSVFAATPQDLGIKSQISYQKNTKTDKTAKSNTIVGTISAISDTGFTLDIKNLKTKLISSVDVKTDTTTIYKKDGVNATVLDLAVAQKAITVGTLDKTNNILTARTVKIITKAVVPKSKKNTKTSKIPAKTN